MPLNPQDCNNLLILARLGLSKMAETAPPDQMIGGWDSFAKVAAGFTEMFNKPAEKGPAAENGSDGTVATDGKA